MKVTLLDILLSIIEYKVRLSLRYDINRTPRPTLPSLTIGTDETMSSRQLENTDLRGIYSLLIMRETKVDPFQCEKQLTDMNFSSSLTSDP